VAGTVVVAPPRARQLGQFGQRARPRAISRPTRSAPPARARLDRLGGQHQPGDHDSAVGGRAFYGQGKTPLAVNHQGLLVANTISFNLPPGVAQHAVAAIEAP
jgi:multidrug efflux pump